jgi:hypothetical protein
MWAHCLAISLATRDFLSEPAQLVNTIAATPVSQVREENSSPKSLPSRRNLADAMARREHGRQKEAPAFDVRVRQDRK